MKKTILAIGLGAIFFLGASSAMAAQAPRIPKIVFNPPKTIPPIRIGQPYPGFSFCNPAPTMGFCTDQGGNPHGGNPPYHFDIGTAGGFPPIGISLDLNGNLIGTPNPASKGPYKFSVCAIDMSGSFKCKPVTINVLNLDGDYTGTIRGVIDYEMGGTRHRESFVDALEATVTGNSFTITLGGSGTLTIDDDRVTGQANISGIPCGFSGTFVTSRIGSSKAAGTFRCVINQGGADGDITGTWRASN